MAAMRYSFRLYVEAAKSCIEIKIGLKKELFIAALSSVCAGLTNSSHVMEFPSLIQFRKTLKLKISIPGTSGDLDWNELPKWGNRLSR